MKKHFKLAIVLSILSLQIACSEQNEAVKVTSDFWKGMSTNNKILLESVLENKSDAEFLSQGKSTLLNYEVLGEVPNGVEVKFSKFCYADMVIPTILKKVDGALKVDFRLTLREQMKAHRNAETLRAYCYDFDEKPLDGTLAGKPWSFVKSKSHEINWGDKITINTKLYSEDCDTETHGECTKPSLIISNLNLEGSGGNFTNAVNITIHVPPGDNQVISTGSYRVSRQGTNKKVELSFEHDPENKLSGYFIIEGE